MTGGQVLTDGGRNIGHLGGVSENGKNRTLR